ncbi:MAG: hypothetical protein A3D34_00850 [Candidatus Staskawiczbacteria bacterium RIFCSPHIGHO2_02_FULL_33_16]|uniref:HIT domain-containing protein n=1 Tax=Candidatus Staskawiczbacteria bacterium RIFCSPHIGHO2_02_FULL_33_16 TaxID=1802204 RepID=A0A1G2HY06_9BACT|nr:MAG: hypothetical protein A3D34_00850 [Candidatus Staskawiczbacteria bacterium RIFCSPHIGHO2_02_FULL_33_16]OGZ70472.1 MAG: hypothetical protein A2980_00775 [Candidatus Staskawiczbacteria bacterium RIFCSPLOWO2_01_FULL_33_13]
MDCIFCKIIKGEIPCFKIFEDKTVFVFLDVSPITLGHCLIIPKTHFENIFDINDSDLQKIIVVAKKLSEKIKNNLRADGIRISQSNGKAAGQDIMHFHLHIIPRYKNDGFSNNPALTIHSPKADFKELKELVKKIQSL